MKRVRLLVIAAAMAGAFVLAVVALAFNSSFQTYVVRRALAREGGVRATVGSVSAGLKRVEIRSLRFEQAGAVLTVPAIEADLPVITAGMGRQALVSRFVAKGWTLDLSRQAGVQAQVPAGVAVPAAASAAVAKSFSGLFGHFQLPVDVAVDGVQLEGEVILPGTGGRARIVIEGGGLGAGREGKFNLTADAALTDPAVNVIKVRVVLAAAMDTPRTLTRLVARLDAEASGARFPNGVKLAADSSAARAALGESYRVAVVAQDRQLLMVQGDFPAHARRLDGTWKMDVRDSDIMPFALGHPLPVFSVAGEGSFDLDAAFTGVHANGRLSALAERLAALLPELSAVGPVRLNADFDVAQRGDLLVVERINAGLQTAQPVAQIQALQPFEFNPRTGALKAADPTRELLDVVLQGLPLAWVAPFLKDVAISGGDVRGEIVATTRGGGLTLRARTPLTVASLALSRANGPLLKGVDLSISMSADYTPQGWQTEVNNLTARSDRGVLIALEAKAGQLAGAGQPIKATGNLSANLPAWLTQPIAGQAFLLSGGDAKVEFVASLAAKQEMQVKISLRNLGVAGAEALPDVTADIRADITPAGQVAINTPITLERGGRKSDLTLAGTLAPGKDTQKIEAQIVSTQLYFEDARILAAILPPGGAPVSANAAPGGPDRAPPWAGLSGSIGLHLKKVIYSDLFQVSDLAGNLRIDAGALKLEKFQAGLGEGGSAKLAGAVTFHRADAQPYALEAALTVTEFDPGPVFRSVNPDQPATVEGRFNLESKLSGRALNLGDLAAGTAGDVLLTSRGGTFRGIPVSVAAKLEATSSLAAGIARLGNLANAISGKSDRTVEAIANRAQAVAELAKYWREIPYDQLSVTLSRDAQLDTRMNDFTLISPEIRLVGTGLIQHRAGSSMLEDALAIEFKLRARGHHAELLKYLGVLEETADELGYFTSTLPLKVAGSLGKPDTSELNSQLASIALEKSGVSEKAMELFNRLRGGK